MGNLLKKDEYYDDFSKIIEMIETRRNNAYRKVNEELISLYWDVGKFVSEQIESNKWGSKVVDNLATFIKDKYPTLQGFSRREFIEWFNSMKLIKMMKLCHHWWHN